MKSETEPQADFDPVARVYRWAEYASLGPLLEQTRNHFLSECAGRRQALVLGDGDGRFLARLLQANAALEVCAVDTSAAMLQLLRARCAQWGARLQITQTSALQVAVPASTDLVVTHFFLDCLTQTEVDGLIDRLAREGSPRMLWLVSDFGLPHAQALRPLAALYIRALYLAFRWLTGLRVTQLPATQDAFASFGFQRIARHERLGGLLYTELWARR